MTSKLFCQIIKLFNWCCLRDEVNNCAMQKTDSSPAFQQNMNGNSTTKFARTQTKTKRYTCSMCNISFSSAGNLKRHGKTLTEEKPYVCSLCFKSLNRSYNLTIHMRIHTGEKPYICALCSISFSSLRSLKSHIRIHTRD